MSFKYVLLAGVSLATVCASAANAKSTPVLLAQMRPGHAVLKTAYDTQRPPNVIYTYSVSTSVSTSADFRKKTKLLNTYYTFLNSGTFCNPPKEKLTLPTHKTAYAKLNAGTESYSEGCGTPTRFYGTVYDLQTKKGVGRTDQFNYSLIARDVHYGGMVYRKVIANYIAYVKISQ